MAEAQLRGNADDSRVKLGQIAGIVVVLAVALAVRLVGIGWGLPDDTHLFSYHPDEFHSLRGALSLALGDANPHFFNYGSLYLYLVAAAAALANPALFSQVATATPGGPVLPEALREWTFDARIVTVLLAVATVAVVYATARRIWGHREGLGAGLLLALAPLHVLHSHYATVDVPGAFFTALACYFAVAMVDEPGWRNVLWAGVAAGLAASVKYSGGVALAAPLVAWGIVRWRKRGGEEGASWKALLVMPVAALAAFALT
ncbi:MAG: ArnT family glycosyltransferase, partial [Armatimonadota bacterium]